MKTLKLLLLTAVLLFASMFTIHKMVNWRVTDLYTIKWDQTSFKGLKATIIFDEQNPAQAVITATIETKTINTGNILKSRHAREALETDKYPFITFSSVSVAKTAKGYETTGDLTIKGITQKITIPFTFTNKKMPADFPFATSKTFNGTFTIAPRSFNVNGEGVPDKVTIDLDIPVIE